MSKETTLCDRQKALGPNGYKGEFSPPTNVCMTRAKYIKQFSILGISHHIYFLCCVLIYTKWREICTITLFFYLNMLLMKSPGVLGWEPGNGLWDRDLWAEKLRKTPITEPGKQNRGRSLGASDLLGSWGGETAHPSCLVHNLMSKRTGSLYCLSFVPIAHWLGKSSNLWHCRPILYHWGHREAQKCPSLEESCFLQASPWEDLVVS